MEVGIQVAKPSADPSTKLLPSTHVENGKIAAHGKFVDGKAAFEKPEREKSRYCTPAHRRATQVTADNFAPKFADGYLGKTPTYVAPEFQSSVVLHS